MAVWFATMALLGVYHVIQKPEVLFVLSPHHGAAFLLRHGRTACSSWAMIFSYLNRNAVHEERHYGMPTDQIVEIGTQIDL